MLQLSQEQKEESACRRGRPGASTLEQGSARWPVTDGQKHVVHWERSRIDVKKRRRTLVPVAPGCPWLPYFAHHLESCVKDLLGQLIVHGVWSVICHCIVTHQFEICLRRKRTHQV